ncbi:prenyltransferase/squalene oxidase repeat-containing protein [Candidatus Leptofilum sp.]|uniref:prenyltransferase/squalene oxidase repeat-containing protein n=1 Tax=Candidatus Leptofilum sp. TaxID=3241576 RepID=UPI003B59BC40
MKDILDSNDLARIPVALQKGRDWLKKVCVVTNSGWGWPEIGGEPDVTVWGGALDGLLGLLYSGVAVNDKYIVNGLRLIRSTRARNFGWATEETGWPLIESAESVNEATAWTIICLKKIFNRNLQEPILIESSDYLIQASSPTGGWGSLKGDTPNIYATAVAIWALTGINNDFVQRQLPFLFQAVNSDGGWGFSPKDNQSRVAITGLVLYALLQGDFSIPEPIFDNAIQKLKNSCLQDGTWENELDVGIMKGTKQYYYTRVRHFSISWVVRAFVKALDHGLYIDLVPSIKRILDMQDQAGFWIYSLYDRTPYVWCTQNAICTLAEVEEYMSKRT